VLLVASESRVAAMALRRLATPKGTPVTIHAQGGGGKLAESSLLIMFVPGQQSRAGADGERAGEGVCRRGQASLDPVLVIDAIRRISLMFGPRSAAVRWCLVLEFAAGASTTFTVPC